MNQASAEELLKTRNEGVFLIRDSEGTAGDFGLSVKSEYYLFNMFLDCVTLDYMFSIESHFEFE